MMNYFNVDFKRIVDNRVDFLLYPDELVEGEEENCLKQLNQYAYD